VDTTQQQLQQQQKGIRIKVRENQKNVELDVEQNSLTSARHVNSFEYIRIWANTHNRLTFWDGTLSPYSFNCCGKYDQTIRVGAETKSDLT